MYGSESVRTSQQVISKSGYVIQLIAFRRDMACIHSSPDPSLLCGSGSGLRDQQHLQGSLKFVDNKVTQAKASSNHRVLHFRVSNILLWLQHSSTQGPEIKIKKNITNARQSTDSCRIISVLSSTISLGIIAGSLVPKLSCTRVSKQC